MQLAMVVAGGLGGFLGKPKNGLVQGCGSDLFRRRK
jgi:hypothetical protein